MVPKRGALHQGGSGLGLHISYNAAAKVLGGNLTVVSTPGEGTAFKLLIPVVAPEHEDETSSSGKTPAVFVLTIDADDAAYSHTAGFD